MGSLQDELMKKGLSQNPDRTDFIKDKKRDHDKKKMAKKNKGSSDRNDPTPLCLPLYKNLKDFIIMRDQDVKNFENCPHPGLVFDKFPCHWSGPEKWKEKTDNRKRQDVPDAAKDPECWNSNPKTWFLNKIIQLYTNNDHIEDLLAIYNLRQDLLLKNLSGKSHTFSTHWRFVTGLGMGHVLETGFIWHRTLGVPYLPGSSVKGLIRAWAKQWEGEDVWKKAKHLFGDSDELGAGKLIVFDAIPIKKPTLELDIMNPHYAPYYEDKSKPPADYYSPRPIFFIAVAHGSKFRFSIAPRTSDVTINDVCEGLNLLQQALENLGAGAKTAVGYGYFK